MIILSPAKTQDFSIPAVKHVVPPLIHRSIDVMKELRQLSKEDVASLMKIKGELLEKCCNSLTEWNPKADGIASPALYSYTGEVFKQLDASSLDSTALAYAQEYLFILSGLYGVLRSETTIMPYRLEMQTRLPVSGSKNLTLYWKQLITEYLQSQLALENEPILFNLASAEYFKAINFSLLEAKIVTPQFRVRKDGVLKSMAIYAKKGRGALARFICMNQIKRAEEILHFKEIGFDLLDGSDVLNPVFVFEM